MQAGLVCKDSAADAWEVIRRMGGDRIKEATADKLCRDFTDLQFKPGECVEDFAMCATTIVNQLQDVSDKITDKEVIKKILHTPSPSNSNKWQSRLRHYLISMPCQLRSPLDTCAVVEERKKKPTSGAKEGRLLLTEEEWMAYLKAGEGELSSGGRGGRGHGGVGALAMTAEGGDHFLIQMKNTRAGPGQLISVTPVVSLVIGLKSRSRSYAFHLTSRLAVNCLNYPCINNTRCVVAVGQNLGIDNMSR
jgi:hypothetical protein